MNKEQIKEAIAKIRQKALIEGRYGDDIISDIADWIEQTFCQEQEKPFLTIPFGNITPERQCLGCKYEWRGSKECPNCGEVVNVHEKKS